MLSGCTAVHKGIKYSDLDVQTKMSQTVFLDPSLSSQKLVYLEIRNTSDKPQFEITSGLKTALESKGYKIVSAPSEATTVLQINILSVGRVREEEAFAALGSGFGGVLSGLSGASIGSLAGGLVTPHSYTGFGVGALVGGAASIAADALVEVMTYNLVTDLQITQKPVGTAASPQESKTYQTRIVSMARKANLEFEEAVPSLQQGLINSLSGLLP